MSDRDPRNEGRVSRSSDGRGSRISSYGRRSDEAGQLGPDAMRASGSRPQRVGPGAVPGVVALDSSRPVVRYPMSADTAIQEDAAGRVRSLADDTGALGRAKPTDIAPTPTAAVRGNMRGRRAMYDMEVTRPESVAGSKKGLTGPLLQLKTNYFRVQRKKIWGLYQYHIDFAPEVDSTGIRKSLMRPFKNQFSGFIFDGSMLWTTTKLQNEVTKLTAAKADGSPVIITVKLTKEVQMNESASLQILNVVLRNAIEKLKLQLVGRNYFDPIAKIAITDFRLELWPGYITSIRQHENDILMCTEISSKIMRQENLLNILQDCVKNHREYKETFSKMVIGSTVLTDYNNKTYRIDDVDWDSSPSTTFDTRDGPKSFIDYYRTRYNISIRDHRQPLLISRSKDRQRRQGQDEKISLIPELCRATGFTDDMRNNFRLMKAVAEHTRLGPAQRVRRLLAFNQRLQNTPESVEVFREWNMRLSPDLVDVTGRELPPEKIVFANRDANGTLEADWTREFRNSKLFTTVPLDNWHVIAPNRAKRETTDFIKILQEAVAGMGFRIGQPQLQMIESDRNDEIMHAIDNCIKADPQLIMIVVTNNNSSRYAAIKKKCCVDRAIPTQVMVLKTITPKGGNVRGLMSVGTKVAIQLNCKLGAAPWFVKLPLNGTMIVGFDVFHDTKNRALSYGALVASMDLRESCKYFTTVTPHRNGEELANNLTLNFTKALKEYRLEHGSLPSRIIIYRDGVGEGQLHYVVEHELESFKKEMNKHYQNAGQGEARVAFVIVNKRLNTRIFNQDRNPNPGTIVDDVITLPERYDFYLVSQSVRQGTVSPTAYNVIYDTLGLPPDKLQILTYKMCHLYYNWSGTTRVPAVCQYAHKLAQLVGEHIHQSPSQALSKQLYFL